jgi:CMP-N-acetylneuraminic acid synthetase
MSETASPTPDINPRRVLCLIPARSGSVRVPDKNVQPVGARTLLERAIATAVSAFGRVVVSTDSPDYARLSVSAGAEVPGLRPPALARSETPIDSVVQHALQSWNYPDAEVMVLMQTTSPFTTPADLHAVVAALDASSTAGCALTVAPVPTAYASLMAVDPSDLADFVAPTLARLRTQDVPRLGVPTGGAYAARVVRLRRGEPLLRSPYCPVWVDPWRALDIDTPEDLERARSLVGGGR